MKTRKPAPSKKTSRYVLEISARQAEMISQAVELTARLGMGQFEELDRFFWPEIKGDQRDEVREHCQALCRIKNGAPHQYPGIHSDAISDDYRVLFDLHRVVRHRLAWDRNPNPPNFAGVAFDTPRPTSKIEDLAKIEKVAAKRASGSKSGLTKAAIE